MVRLARPSLPCNGEIATREIDLYRRSMISGVLARSVTSRAPLLGAYTDQVEKWTHVLGG